MLRMIRSITLPVAALAALLAPPRASAAPPDDVVAEALFLCDALPPGGRDLNLSLGVARAAPDPVTGASPLVASPRAQLALALGERVGLTADVGLGTNGNVLDAPGASLKLLLRAPGAGRTGVAASLDLLGGSHDPLRSEAGVGLGVIRAVGRVTLRGGASLSTPLAESAPHLHAGASAAVALGARWRLLGEVVTTADRGAVAWAAGPTVKLALREGTAVAAGALAPLDGGAPTVTVQLSQGL